MCFVDNILLPLLEKTILVIWLNGRHYLKNKIIISHLGEELHELEEPFVGVGAQQNRFASCEVGADVGPPDQVPLQAGQEATLLQIITICLTTVLARQFSIHLVGSYFV
jgi:hypothetical protein